MISRPGRSPLVVPRCAHATLAASTVIAARRSIDLSIVIQYGARDRNLQECTRRIGGPAPPVPSRYHQACSRSERRRVSLTYSIDERLGLITMTVSGQVTAAGITAYVAARRRDPAYRPRHGRDVFWTLGTGGSVPAIGQRGERASLALVGELARRRA